MVKELSEELVWGDNNLTLGPLLRKEGDARPVPRPGQALEFLEHLAFPGLALPILPCYWQFTTDD